MERDYYRPQTREDVTPEILEAAEDIEQGWYQDVRIDWEDFWDRLDGSILDDGRVLDLGSDLDSVPLRTIKAHIRKLRASASG